jgi:hypothetical protein
VDMGWAVCWVCRDNGVGKREGGSKVDPGIEIGGWREWSDLFC